jgi:hypothetical protein
VAVALAIQVNLYVIIRAMLRFLVSGCQVTWLVSGGVVVNVLGQPLQNAGCALLSSRARPKPDDQYDGCSGATHKAYWTFNINALASPV